ncbi:DUF4974 domain-containing protein [Puteibacter caeruleilacunae]|nr:DUF4974 domain-containing protein [Puteibacter caeruleilacunae]
MTNKLFSNLSVEELVHDQMFIEIVNGLGDVEWQSFLDDNSENRKNIEKASKIIRAFKVNQGTLDQERKNKLWTRIDAYNKDVKNKRGTSVFRTIMRVAASIVVLLSLGGALYFYVESNIIQYQFSENNAIENNENSVLILSSGEKVTLKEEQSEIAVLEEQEAILIENDTIIENHAEKDVKTKAPRLTEVIVPFGKKTVLTLNDGTKVWLNAGSRFAFPQKFEGNEREVFLDGEGYFEVAKNRAKPFIVSSKNLNIKVLGTKFNVSSYNVDNFSETVLLEGSVKISSRNKLLNEKVIMTPNQIASYDVENKVMALSSDTDPDRFISWINDWYEFNHVGLDRVLTKLERYYNVTFEYSDDLIENALPITGKLDLKGSLQEVIFVLTKVADVDCEFLDDRIIIKPIKRK